jgi:hypothetical protein
VSLCYDLNAMLALTNRKQTLLRELTTVRVSMEDHPGPDVEAKEADLQNQVRLLDKELQALRQSTPRSVGAAIVTLSEEADVPRIVAEHGYSVGRTVLDQLLGYLRTAYPVLDGHSVYITAAPAPKDLKWENLELRVKRSFGVLLLNVAMIAVILYLEFRLEVALL